MFPPCRVFMCRRSGDVILVIGQQPVATLCTTHAQQLGRIRTGRHEQQFVYVDPASADGWVMRARADGGGMVIYPPGARVPD